MEFREGDLIVGKHDAPYAITRPGVICQVVHDHWLSEDSGYIAVETGPFIDPKLEPHEGGIYRVNPKFFMLYDANKDRDAFDAAIQSLLLGGGA